ncbi:TRAP transporter small permease [Ramlibacter sp. AW1]|uniref:TRAP transporter small permease protein n=1 Tax=Ramlibacter aurantiacus TaxID=2801330 RepID=A0A936ZT82_9BURK|nr:TRAP transporter small permease [Ramlibacter aurantiacus]MBL0420720.1 TRAP transporter small permease [Ramlibacter aurantiacus]
MRRFHAFVEAVNGWFLTFSGVAVLLVLVGILWEIVSRNVFGLPTSWALDASRFALVFIFFLALAPALQSGSHVAVDILYEYLPAGPKRAMQIVALLLVVGFALLLLWYVWQETYEAFLYDGSFTATIPVKMKTIYWVGPLGVVQFLLTAVSLLLRSLQADPLARRQAVPERPARGTT